MSTEPFELRPGHVFAGEFRVLGLIGRGGMGAVYRVEQLSTGRQRALKLLAPLGRADPRARERFELEARIGARIASQHVVEVIAAGVEGEPQWPWIAMELLEGMDLRSLVLRHGRLSFVQTQALAEQIVHGLAAAHRAGVIHRDLKPENVFVARSSRSDAPFTVKLLDFGIAKLLTEGRAAVSATSTVGTPLWIAPEQLSRGKLSVRTDIWALGLLVFFTLTGHSYWESAADPEVSIEALLTEILMAPLPRASERARALGVPTESWAELDRWFDRCVARDPEQRFAGVEHAGVDLGHALESLARSPHGAGLDQLLPALSTLPSDELAFDDTLHGEPATEARTEAPSAPRLAGETELLANDFFLVTSRPDGVIHVRRTDRKSDDVEGLVHAAERMLEITHAEHVRSRPLLIDFRAASPRNDPEFEKSVYKFRAVLGRKGRRTAYLMSSAIGVLQMQRLAKSVSATIATFCDEAEAITYLVSDHGSHGSS